MKKPSEFLRQTSRIRKSAEKWLTDTDILNIRKNVPKLEVIDPSWDKEERQRAFEENKHRTAEQSRKNLSAMLDAILDEHPDETLELLALLCFIEPDKADDYPISEYIGAISEMLSNEAVIGFFTSLARLGLTSTSDA